MLRWRRRDTPVIGSTVLGYTAVSRQITARSLSRANYADGMGILTCMPRGCRHISLHHPTPCTLYHPGGSVNALSFLSGSSAGDPYHLSSQCRARVGISVPGQRACHWTAPFLGLDLMHLETLLTPPIPSTSPSQASIFHVGVESQPASHRVALPQPWVILGRKFDSDVF